MAGAMGSEQPSGAGYKGSGNAKGKLALLEAPECGAEIEITEDGARIKNGKIRAEVSKYGKITFYNQKGKLLLEEYSRTRKDLFAKTCSALEVEPGSSSRF